MDFALSQQHRLLCDARLTEIGEGTSEIQRLVIAKHALGHAGRR